jgi:hypothetical protein
MKVKSSKNQAGFALILFVLAFMTAGGLLLIGFSEGMLESAEAKKFEHNKRVLEEAKQALLQSAYNYPVTNDLGPGRLPNADTDNDGVADGGSTFGRLPWAQQNLNLYDIRDADGERLWYAVSSSFRPQAAIINSDTSGSLTLRDQGGNVIYDGSNPGGLTQYGVAAVIIAPGAITARNGVNQDRSVANVNDPVHYLDLVVGTEDNATVTQSSATDGFILGPVDRLSTDAVNDRFIVITAAEVAAVAEKATLQAYRTAINDYLTMPGNFYPWMNAYADISDLTIYDTVPGRIVGRVPFLNYYMDYDSHTVITDLIIEYDIDMADTADGNDPGYISAFLSGTQILDISRSNLSFKQETFDLSANNGTDNLGTLISQADGTTVVNAPGSFSTTLYFWDGCATCDITAEDGWELCPVGLGDERDCSKDNNSPYNFEPWSGDWSNHADIKVRRVELQFDFDAEFEIGLDYSLPPVGIDAPDAPTATLNSRRRVKLDPASVTDFAVDGNSTIPDTTDFIDITIIDCSGDDITFNSYDPTPNCSPTISASVTVNQLDITADYFPELPLWVSQNNWNNSILMTYADEYRPGGTSSCTPEDGDPGTGATDDCIVVNNAGGINNNIVSLLVIAGEHDLIDGDDLNDDGDFVDLDEDIPDNLFSNDLHDIFETENYSGIGPYPSPNNDPDPASDTGLRLVFDKREDSVDGNSTDIMLILDAL